MSQTRVLPCISSFSVHRGQRPPVHRTSSGLSLDTFWSPSVPTPNLGLRKRRHFRRSLPTTPTPSHPRFSTTSSGPSGRGSPPDVLDRSFRLCPHPFRPSTRVSQFSSRPVPVRRLKRDPSSPLPSPEPPVPFVIPTPELRTGLTLLRGHTDMLDLRPPGGRESLLTKAPGTPSGPSTHGGDDRLDRGKDSRISRRWLYRRIDP